MWQFLYFLCNFRLVRGKARSVSFEEILQRIQSVQLADGKSVLTGVNLGAWGLDLNPRTDLTGLLKRILMETDIPRIRALILGNLESNGGFCKIMGESKTLSAFSYSSAIRIGKCIEAYGSENQIIRFSWTGSANSLFGSGFCHNHWCDRRISWRDGTRISADARFYPRSVAPGGHVFPFFFRRVLLQLVWMEKLLEELLKNDQEFTWWIPKTERPFYNPLSGKQCVFCGKTVRFMRITIGNYTAWPAIIYFIKSHFQKRLQDKSAK